MVDGGKPKGKVSASKGNTPSATTAAQSRGTHSPLKKLVKDDGKVSAMGKSVSRKPSVVKSALENSPQVPKGLKSAHKGNHRFKTAGHKVKYILPKVLNIGQLLDMDMREFERLNRSTLNFSYHIYNLMEAGGNQLQQSPVKKQRRKVSELNLNVGLGKRVDPHSDSARKKARKAWENLNVKKDHVMQFTTKSASDRVL